MQCIPFLKQVLWKTAACKILKKQKTLRNTPARISPASKLQNGKIQTTSSQHCLKAVVQRSSVKKVFLEISQNSQEARNFIKKETLVQARNNPEETSVR